MYTFKNYLSKKIQTKYEQIRTYKLFHFTGRRTHNEKSFAFK